MSGYVPCACRDCMDIAMSGDDVKPALCWACADAGCSPDGDEECQRDPDFTPGSELTEDT